MKTKTPNATRRTILGASLGATASPFASAGIAHEADLIAEGEPGPGRILVWVDERQWRALIRAANALGPGAG